MMTHPSNHPQPPAAFTTEIPVTVIPTVQFGKIALTYKPLPDCVKGNKLLKALKGQFGYKVKAGYTERTTFEPKWVKFAEEQLQVRFIVAEDFFFPDDLKAGQTIPQVESKNSVKLTNFDFLRN